MKNRVGRLGWCCARAVVEMAALCRGMLQAAATAAAAYV